MDSIASVPPVRKSVEVPVTPRDAFALFTGDPMSWWPPDHRLTEHREDIVFEPFPGGRWYERDTAGAERDWGRVLDWAPPGRVRLSWLIDGEFQPIEDDTLASRVEITFTESARARTTVELAHVELHRHGPTAARIRAAIGGPSPGDTLARFAAAVERRKDAGMYDDAETPPRFPWRRSCPFAPPKPYEERRAAPSIAKTELSTGGQAWILTGYDQVRTALADPRLSNDRRHPGFPSPIPVPPEFQNNASLLGMDAPEHTRYRKMVTAPHPARR